MLKFLRPPFSDSLLEGYEYSNLEDPSIRSFAEEDPKAYLAQFKSKTIIDEIQRVPTLLSYIQVIVDEEKSIGKFVLTGSHQLQLQEAISQSLAGRTAILKLLPLSINELKKEGIEFNSFEEYCIKGFLPRIHDQSLRATTVYSNYYQTYVERDVKEWELNKLCILACLFARLLRCRNSCVACYAPVSTP